MSKLRTYELQNPDSASVNIELTPSGGTVLSGVVTATTLKVGTGVTISSGVVTATSFSGDGSALTGIDATSLKDSGGSVKIQANTSGAVVTGVLTSTSFSGPLTGNVTGNVTGDVNAGVVTATSSIVVGNSFINATSIGIATVSTAQKTGLSTSIGQIVYDYTTGSLEIWNGLQWSQISAAGNNVDLVIATGGTITELPNPVSGTDRLHSFYSSDSTPATGTFTVTYVAPGTTAEVLVVGGGGDQGANCGGGGGGIYISPNYPLSSGSYPIVAGGAPENNPGEDTTAFGLTAGGGGGGTGPTQPGNAGRPAGGNGSGGGGVWGSGGNPGGPGASISPSGTFTGYGGNSGGANAPGGNPNGWGGGGGGATGAGGNANGGGPGGSGGAGISSSITGSSLYYAVGGAGSSGTQATGSAYRVGSGNGGYYGGPQGAGAPGKFNGSPGGVYIRYKWKN